MSRRGFFIWFLLRLRRSSSSLPFFLLVFLRSLVPGYSIRSLVPGYSIPITGAWCFDHWCQALRSLVPGYSITVPRSLVSRSLVPGYLVDRLLGGSCFKAIFNRTSNFFVRITNHHTCVILDSSFPEPSTSSPSELRRGFPLCRSRSSTC